jgi:hypothetical protein
MNRLALAPVLGLALVGCAHSQAPSSPLQMEEARCELVQTLVREPVVAQRLAEMVSDGRELPLPVTVFVRNPEEGRLERLFEDDLPECGGEQFRVVRQLSREGLVLYLQESPEGYAYDARRAGPEDLSIAGSPQGFVRRNSEGGWVASSLD